MRHTLLAAGVHPADGAGQFLLFAKPSAAAADVSVGEVLERPGSATRYTVARRLPTPESKYAAQHGLVALVVASSDENDPPELLDELRVWLPQ